MNIAFLTSSNYQSILDKCPEFLDEYQVLAPLFTRAGAELILADWRDPEVDWAQFDLLIPKACWDYTEHAQEFERFIKKIIANDLPMQNPAKVVLWNMRKTYLAEIQKKGLPVGELHLVAQGSRFQLDELLKNHSDWVAKPSIGAGASDTIKFHRDDAEKHLAQFEKILKYADLILQPYFPEIAETGELSFFFFGGEFSHALLKLPKKGDFRAHQLYGAENRPYQPTPEEIEQARSFLNAAPEACAYGRVDVFRRNGKFYLIELELIEPYSYFEVGTKEAPHNFVNAILKSAQRKSP